jgi:hypothetical protein
MANQEPYDASDDVPNSQIANALMQDLIPFPNTLREISEDIEGDSPGEVVPETTGNASLGDESESTDSDESMGPETTPENENGESTDGGSSMAGDEDTEPGQAGEKIEFGTLDEANEFRDSHQEHLHDSDTRRTKTITFRADTPEEVLDDAGTMGMVSHSKGKSYGQAELTDAERDRLEDRESFDYAQGHLFHARSAKALLQAEGGTPWLDFYDPRLAVDEHLSVIERGKDMAAQERTSGPGEMNLDNEKSDKELAQDLEQAQGEQCSHARDGCEDGYDDACDMLVEECGYTEAEVEKIVEATYGLGEDPEAVYDPTADTEDIGASFEEWAAETAPEQPEMPDKPDAIKEPDDGEIAALAPADDPEELSGPALRTLKKAWSGYKMARAEDRKAHDRMAEYAGIINGVRAVNGQEPIDFEAQSGWDGGEVLPDDPDDTYPTDSGQKTITESIEAGTAGILDDCQSSLENCYDPSEEWS